MIFKAEEACDVGRDSEVRENTMCCNHCAISALQLEAKTRTRRSRCKNLHLGYMDIPIRFAVFSKCGEPVSIAQLPICLGFSFSHSGARHTLFLCSHSWLQDFISLCSTFTILHVKHKVRRDGLSSSRGQCTWHKWSLHFQGEGQNQVEHIAAVPQMCRAMRVILCAEELKYN